MGNDELLNYISMFREKAEQGKLVIERAFKALQLISISP